MGIYLIFNFNLQKKTEVLDFLDSVREVFRSECDAQVMKNKN
jgi:hypothetical protein